ncbi:RHS repeat domain-containing protein, partial [Marinobacter profundi]
MIFIPCLSGRLKLGAGWCNTPSPVPGLQLTTQAGYVDTVNQNFGIEQVVDSNGHTWNYSYDARGNQLTQTDGMGNTVAYTYNSRGQELTLADARGNVYQNSYDSVGNLL